MIKGLSTIRRCPRLGSIRLGIKKISPKTGKQYPCEVDYFILDPNTGNTKRDDELKQQFKNLYGEQPKSIKIMFPPVSPELFCQSWYKRYGSGTLLKCKGDGETATCALPEFAQGLEVIGKNEMGMTQVKCDGPECIYQKDKSCHRLSTIQLLLPDLNAIGVWQINTTSWNNIVNLNSAIDWLTGICGRFQMIPLTLNRVPQDIPFEGKKSTHFILQIDLNISIAQIQRAALIAPEKALIESLPAPEESKPELLYMDAEEKQTENSFTDDLVEDLLNETKKNVNESKQTELKKEKPVIPPKEKRHNGTAKSTAADLRRIEAIATSKGWTTDDIQEYIAEVFDVDAIELLTKDQVEILFNYIKNN